MLRPERLPPGGVAEAGVAPAECCKPTEPCLVSLAGTGTGRCFIDTEVTSLRFAVIGAGRLGASLGLALRAHGLPLVGFTASTPAGRTRAEAWLGSSSCADLPELVAMKPDLYVIAVPDSALPEVAESLALLLRDTTATFVAHTSGATSVRALDPCALAGATTLVFHPLQTFSDPISGCERFTGTAVAVTPDSLTPGSPAEALGFAIARLLECRPFLLADDKRALYHAAATLACNYFVTLEHQAHELFVRSGLPSDQALTLFLPLVEATLTNIRHEGTVKALTGALSRGDIPTVRSHLAALEQDAPELLPLYRTLGLATLDLVSARRELDVAVVEDLAGLLRSPSTECLPKNAAADTDQK